jgi:hypothetical protein
VTELHLFSDYDNGNDNDLDFFKCDCPDILPAITAN